MFKLFPQPRFLGLNFSFRSMLGAGQGFYLFARWILLAALVMPFFGADWVAAQSRPETLTQEALTKEEHGEKTSPQKPEIEKISATPKSGKVDKLVNSEEVKTTTSEVKTNMESRSLDSQGVLTVPDPKFIYDGNSTWKQGVYFGVGFRQVQLEVRSRKVINPGAEDEFLGKRGRRSFVDTDGTVNGIAFNLGYLSEVIGYEYDRNVTILDLRRTLEFQNKTRFNFLQVIQNNFWVLFPYRIARDFYFQAGLGVQSAEIQLIQKQNTTTSQTTTSNTSTSTTTNNNQSSTILREDFFLGSLGLSYFVTSNFLLQYRFSMANFSPILTGSGVDNFLRASQHNTIYFEYYFGL